MTEQDFLKMGYYLDEHGNPQKGKKKVVKTAKVSNSNMIPMNVLTALAEPTITFHVVPLGKPRMTQGDKWLFKLPESKLSEERLKRKRMLQRYWAYKEVILQTALSAGFEMPESNFWMLCHIPVPKSWSKRLKASKIGEKHQVKPDRDNIEKGVIDSLCKEDSYIWDGRETKVWCAEGEGRIEIYCNN